MSGFSFARIEVFARKSRSDSRSNRTAGEVLDEAERVPGNMPHVPNPKPPKVVDGCSFEELRAAHDAVEQATQTQKNGRTRKIRSTQNTLATAVLSYPVSCQDLAAGSPEQRETYKQWRADAIRFMREEWGSDYKCAVQHLDEKFPHLHMYAVRPDFDAKQNHPGYAAQAEAKASGASPKAAEIAGALALKDFLDRYQEQVGNKYGMNRYGPKRSRMTRKAWVKTQMANDDHAKKLRDREGFKQEIKDEVAQEWAKTSIVGKVSYARSSATRADIKKAANHESKRAVEAYASQFENSEKAIRKAVNSKEKAQERAGSLEKINTDLHSQNSNLTMLLDDAKRSVAVMEYTLSENIKSLHRTARLTNKEADYVSLSAACQSVFEMKKAVQDTDKTLFAGVWGDVKAVVSDVSKRVPNIFRKVFSWAVSNKPKHSHVSEKTADIIPIKKRAAGGSLTM